MGVEGDITVRLLQARHSAVIRLQTTRERLSGEVGIALPEVWEALEEARVKVVGPPFARYFAHDRAGVEVEIGFPVKEAIKASGRVQPGRLPGGLTAVAVHRGPYADLHQTYDALGSWLPSKGHNPAGAAWEVYLTDPVDVPDTADWKTEVNIPVQGRNPRDLGPRSVRKSS